jgi:hypothetical protein
MVDAESRARRERRDKAAGRLGRCASELTIRFHFEEKHSVVADDEVRAASDGELLSQCNAAMAD